jgi:putative transposase
LKLSDSRHKRLLIFSTTLVALPVAAPHSTVHTTRFSPNLFVTLRTHARAPLLAEPTLKKLLIHRFVETKKRFSLTVAGYVILDDHAHFLFSIPSEYECSAVMNDLRASFLREWRATLPLRKTVEDTPFWEHGLEYRNLYTTDELRAYLDFVHYDPVRHGLSKLASEYHWSSLPARVAQGQYPENWGSFGPPAAISRIAKAKSTASLNG